MTRTDPRAMLIWLVCALAVSVRSHDLPTLASVVAVLTAVAAAGDDWPTYRRFLYIGAFIVVGRTVLFSLTGHHGSNILFTLPKIPLPIDGLDLGGPVTREVVTSSLLAGGVLMASLAAFGALLSHLRPVQILQLLPSRMAGLGAAVNIGVTLAPALAATATGIREAQRMRGIRGPLPTLGPLLGSALSDSLALAEAMESRGYGSSVLPSRYRKLTWGWRDSVITVTSLVSLMSIWAAGHWTTPMYVAALSSPAILRAWMPR